MGYAKIASKSQADFQVQRKIGDFFNRFTIGFLMHRCGIRKHHGHSFRSLTEAIFTLPFVGKNFFRGIVINDCTYDRSKSKWVELLCRVWDHSSGRFLKGFRMVTTCWSDGGYYRLIQNVE